MKLIYQNEVAECGYACLAMVLTHLGRATEVREISALRPISANGLTLLDLYDVALEFGLEVEAYKFSADQISQIRRGSILHFGGAHFVVFERATPGYVRIIDPAAGRRRIAMDTFLACISGYLIQCSPTPALPRIRSRSRVPRALKQVRALTPELTSLIAKVVFVAAACQFAILAMPYLGKLVLDNVVAQDNLNLLNVLVLTFAGIFLTGALGKYVQGYLTEFAYGKAQINVTQSLLLRVLRNPIPFFEKRNVGDLFSKFRIQSDITAFATRTTISMVVDGCVALIALALMLVLSPQLTAVALGVFTTYVAVALALYVRMRETHELVMEESARCDDALFETFRAAAMIKLSSGEVRRTTQYLTRFRGYSAAQLHHSRLEQVRGATLQLLNYGELLAVMWLAANQMVAGAMSMGVFYSFMIYKSLLSERLSNVINGVVSGLMLSVPASRVADLVEQEPERYASADMVHRTPETRAFESIQIQDVTFRYGVSDQPVLREANLSIRRGDKIAISGPSGSGKSTLFKLIGAVEPLQQGEMAFNGIAWSNVTVDEVRRHIAQTRQGDIILHGSIADNVTMFKGQVDEDRLHRTLEEVGLLPDIMRLPMRSRTVISDSIANISAGQRQRLLLARALYEEKEVLLLDEPTSNLDPASVRLIGDLLLRLDRTVVVITHDESLASRFPQRYRLCDGALVAQGAA
ncbi:peptidase domain-containing ABC transporter [Paraburkholderia dinghuensis]|uniref:Peptidase domain-containing ABC transporter n=1 Tax=Paraburkholderia dinghuensis TaxID=2305225 RepID=A0A3N6MW33_9BURK|nr:peptidase domain-containing ABC transporter [Paraburkholderia dinghuensis]RQH00572.1 peptidase domain-containing ABC transporter [Paraburkholderia dinghuensis]